MTYKEVLNTGLIKSGSRAIKRYIERNLGKLTRQQIRRFIDVARATRGWKPPRVPGIYTLYLTRPKDISKYYNQTVEPLLLDQIKNKKDLSYLYPSLSDYSKQILDSAIAKRNKVFGKWRKITLLGLEHSLINDLYNTPVYGLLESPVYSHMTPIQQKTLRSLFKLTAPTHREGLSKARLFLYKPKGGIDKIYSSAIENKLYDPYIIPDKNALPLKYTILWPYVWKGTNLDKFIKNFKAGEMLWEAPNPSLAYRYMPSNEESGVLIKLLANKLKLKGLPVKHVAGGLGSVLMPFKLAYLGIFDNTSGKLNDIIKQIYKPDINGVMYPAAKIKPTIWNKLYWGDLYNHLI